jgi:2-iminobutanoate/2-iminopropanoate deaminase
MSRAAGIRHTAAQPASERYSAAVSGAGLIVTCGQLGVAAGEAPVPFAVEAERALRSLVSVVEQAGGSIETILRINGYLADVSLFAAYDAAYMRVISVDPKPARTTVVVAGFKPPIQMEVEALALVA